MFLLTGCNTNDSTEEKFSAEEESYTREITDEEKGYKQLLLDHEYDELLKQTINNNGEELKSDYVYLGIAFQRQEELREDIIELNKKKDNESLSSVATIVIPFSFN